LKQHVTYIFNGSGGSANVEGPLCGCDITTILWSLQSYISHTIHSSYTPTQLTPLYATESNTAWLRFYIVFFSGGIILSAINTLQ